MELKRTLIRTGALTIGLNIPRVLVQALSLKPGDEVSVLLPDQVPAAGANAIPKKSKR